MLDAAEIRSAVQQALTEDVGPGDVTTLSTVPADATANAVMRAREALTVAGLAFAETAFRELSSESKVTLRTHDGKAVTLRIGAPTQRGEYYVDKVGDRAAFLVNRYAIDRFLKRSTDLVR